MERPDYWKVLTVGLALTGLGFIGAGTALANGTPQPASSVTTVADDDWDDWGDWDDWYDD